MFNSCAALRPYIGHIDDIYKDFTSYKFRVPVTGAIILDETYERVSLLSSRRDLSFDCIIAVANEYCSCKCSSISCLRIEF